MMIIMTTTIDERSVDSANDLFVRGEISEYRTARGYMTVLSLRKLF